MKSICTLLGFFLLVGCAQEEAQHLPNLPEPAAPGCTYQLPKQRLCARIDWISGPRAGSDSTFEVRVWSPDGRALDRGISVSAAAQNCCAKAVAVRTDVIGEGQYRMTPNGLVALSHWTFEVEVRENHQSEKFQFEYDL